MRPAEVCGCVSSPKRSSSASSARTVDGDTVIPARTTGLFEPTGSPLSTYSSTTRRRTSAWRSVSVVPASAISLQGILGEQLHGNGAAEPPPARSQDQSRQPVPVGTEGRETEPLDAAERSRIHRARRLGQRQPRVEPQPQHQPLLRARALVQLLDLARRRSPTHGRPHIRFQSGRVPPALVAERRTRADPQPEVVPTEPVREIVLRAQVASIRLEAAEVRRLVPAVAGRVQPPAS